MSTSPRGRKARDRAGSPTPPSGAAIIKAAARPRASQVLTLEPMGAPYRRAQRPAYGSSSEAWEAEFGQQGVLILSPDRREVGTAIARTSARAVLDGVHVADIEILSPSMMIHPGTNANEASKMASQLVGLSHERRDLEQRIAALEREADNARRGSLESTEESNRRRYMQDADRAMRAATKLRKELEQSATSSTPTLPLPALAQVDPVVFALMQVANPAPSFDLTSTYAVQQVIRDLALVPDALMIHGSFLLAVPTKNRQLVLGPMTFRLPNRCRNGVAVYLQQADFTDRTMAPAARTRFQRQELIERLRKGPSALSSGAAATATQAFFGAIPRILLDEDPGERAHAWNDPHWMRLVKDAYRRRVPAAKPAPWLQVSPARQALSYAVADAGRPLTRPEVLEVLSRFGIRNPDTRTHQLTVEHRHAETLTSSSWSWPAALLRQGRGRTWRAWLRSCPRCDGPAEWVCRTPELPFGCMCPCGGAPGLPRDIVVPANFRHLVIPRAWLPEYAAAVAA